MEDCVKISISRYEELLDIETRRNVLISKVRAEKSISVKDLFRTLGYENEANEMQKQEDEEHEKYKEMYFEKLLDENRSE